MLICSCFCTRNSSPGAKLPHYLVDRTHNNENDVIRLRHVRYRNEAAIVHDVLNEALAHEAAS
eukprot:12916166-Prorocentrum_lima.AAC.1